MAKTIAFDEEARRGLEDGMNKLADAFKIGKRYTKFEQVLADPEIDFIANSAVGHNRLSCKQRAKLAVLEQQELARRHWQAQALFSFVVASQPDRHGTGTESAKRTDFPSTVGTSRTSSRPMT